MVEQLKPGQLVEVLRADRRQAWQKGHRILAEEYLRRHPTLQDDPANAVELVYHEVLLREELGEKPQPEEYLQRFPNLASLLEPLFEVHCAIEAGQLFSTAVVDKPTLLATDSTTAMPGPAVAGYEILGRLGRGGMGVVYKARQVRLNRVVALKMILTGPHANEEELARFRTEAETQARLQHPNIVQIHEVGEAAGRPYFALEYVDGGSLDKFLAGKPQPVRAAAQLVETLARAVHYAHQRGLVHRDLKPANILLQKSDIRNLKSEEEQTSPMSDLGFWISDFTPKVTDFGLAKRLEGEAGQTQTGVVVGTIG
jgi:serine/threonine protein kinase